MTSADDMTWTCSIRRCAGRSTRSHWPSGRLVPLVSQPVATLPSTAAHGPLLRAIAEAASHDADVEGVYRRLVQGFVDATAARIRRDVAAGRTSLAHPDHVAAALVWMTERHLAATFGRVGASDADQAAALETLFTIWMRTLYSADPES